MRKVYECTLKIREVFSASKNRACESPKSLWYTFVHHPLWLQFPPSLTLPPSEEGNVCFFVPPLLLLRRGWGWRNQLPFLTHPKVRTQVRDRAVFATVAEDARRAATGLATRCRLGCIGRSGGCAAGREGLRRAIVPKFHRVQDAEE